MENYIFNLMNHFHGKIAKALPPSPLLTRAVEDGNFAHPSRFFLFANILRRNHSIDVKFPVSAKNSAVRVSYIIEPSLRCMLR